ncbi:MAG: DUF1553 domain-containing protein [Planctomycetaceae bacterium]
MPPVPYPKRTTSTTPLQALNLFNSEFLLQQAEIFATRLKREFPEDEQAQLQQAYRLCYAREPAPEELQSAHAFVRGKPDGVLPGATQQQ